MTAEARFPVLETSAQLGLDVELPTASQGEKTLAERFVVPPFTVLDTRQGYWQDRKRAWISLGLQSELGRDVRTYDSTAPWIKDRMLSVANGQSVFDPVLCELLYRWFSPPEGRVLDPFAGGSVRGVVAARLGLDYLGVDLSALQVAENKRQASLMLGAGHIRRTPRWLVGDSRELDSHLFFEEPFDLALSCPPYFDLEVYSEDPADLSRANSYEEFATAHAAIIAAAVETLAPNRFCVWVVGNVRDKAGYFRPLVADTVAAMEAAGARYYNEAIIVNPVGTAMLRVKGYFAPNRKLATLHQHVIIGFKGDVARIRDDFPDET